MNPWYRTAGTPSFIKKNKDGKKMKNRDGSFKKEIQQGRSRSLHICHPKVQEFIQLWEAILRKIGFELKPEKEELGSEKYSMPHGRTNKRANGKKVAKWMIENFTIDELEKYVRQWNRIGN